MSRKVFFVNAFNSHQEAHLKGIKKIEISYIMYVWYRRHHVHQFYTLNFVFLLRHVFQEVIKMMAL